MHHKHATILHRNEEDGILTLMTQTSLDERLLRASQRDLTSVQTLIQEGADPLFYQERLLYLSAEGGHLAVVQYFHQLGLSPTSFEDEALHRSATNGHLHVVQYLIAQGADSAVGARAARLNEQFYVTTWLNNYQLAQAEKNLLLSKAEEGKNCKNNKKDRL